MQANIKSTKAQKIVGVSLVAIFVVSLIAATNSSVLSLTRTASAGYGSDNNDDHGKSAAERRKEERKRNKKHHKKSKGTSQEVVLAKVAEFQSFNTPQNQAAYRTVSAIKKNNPAKFRALMNAFNKYNTVSGRFKTQPSAAMRMFNGYNGYNTYLNYLNKVKK